MSLSWTIPLPVAPPPLIPVDEGTRDLFGYDILFTNGDLQVSPSGGDYIRIGGLDNLKAAIYRRLITRPGEFRFRPSYGAGVQTFVKKAMSQANLDALRNRIIDQLSQDTRITAIDAAVSQVTINGQMVVKVIVKVTAGGNTQTFEPFTFAEEATAP